MKEPVEETRVGLAARATVRMCTSVAAFAIAVAAVGLSGAAAPASADGAEGFDHSAFSALLAEYVDTSGVRYADCAAHPQHRDALRAYVTRLAAATPSRFPSDKHLAFWLNATTR